jgi:ribose/xylose/arabinose/galactoside ABC-type transport system permease subunit
MNTALLIGKHVALYGILAIGMTYVIITGGIDLSVGAIVGLGGMIAGGLLQNGLTLNMFGVTIYFSVPLVVLITIVIGAIIGAINGFIITKFNVAPFIATLGMMYVARGFANIHSNGATYSDLKGNEALGNEGWSFFGSRTLGVPVGLIILFILAIIFAILLKKTSFGWHVFAIGGNEKAAKLSGVKVNKVKILVYMISGICSAIVGIIASSQLAASHPATGESWEMNAIAAAVLGGTSMAGGVGTIGGTIVGAFVIGVINDGMVMCGVSEFWQMVIKGLVIVVAVIVDQFQRNLQAKMALRARNESK